MRKPGLAYRKVSTDSLLQFGCLLFLVTWALLQLWNSRFFEYYDDGVSYLDMSDHFRHGDWLKGISFTWNPLYPIIIAIFFRILQPSTFYEFVALKLVNLSIFLVLLASFEYFLNLWIKTYDDQIKRESNFHALTRRTWLFIGHALFAYSFLCLNGISVDTPDMLAAALMFIAFSMFLKILNGETAFNNFFLFGCVTGISYLAKNAALPSLLMCIPFLCRQRHKTSQFWQKFVITLATLSIVIAPYIGYLSMLAGELMLSPAGKLNYIWFVQSRIKNVHAQGNLSLRRSLIHPTRQIFDNPDVFEFREPVQGTYPPWFDPCYWYQGCTIRPHLGWLSVTALCNFIYYWRILFFSCLMVMIVFRLCNESAIISIRSLAANAPFFVPAITGFLQYIFVTNTIVMFPSFGNRYFGIFVVLFVLAALASLRIKDIQRRILAFKLGIASAFLCILIPITEHIVTEVRYAFRNQQFEHYLVAQQLMKMGLHAGDCVAKIGEEELLVDWARLGRLKIVVDIPDSKDFWSVSPKRRYEVLQTLKRYGVRMAVYFPAPICPQSESLQTYIKTGFFYHLVGLSDPQMHKSRFQPINPSTEEGWYQLNNLPCWIHKI